MPLDFFDFTAAIHAPHAKMDKSLLRDMLADPKIDMATYLSSLQVLKSLFHAIEAERLRHACWPLLSLSAECTALACDTRGFAHSPVPLTFATPQELLGGLYVSHAVGLGRSSFRRNILTKLPHGPHRYILRPFNKITHRLLTNQMHFEGATPAGKDALLTGATHSLSQLEKLTAGAPHFPKNVST